MISEETVNVQGGFEIPEPKRLKQMELEFVKRVSETWPTLSPEMMIPESKKCAKTRRKLLRSWQQRMERFPTSWLASQW